MGACNSTTRTNQQIQNKGIFFSYNNRTERQHGI